MINSAVIAALLVLPACGTTSTSPSSISPPSLTGTWVGGGFFQTCVGSNCQPNGTLSIQLTHSGSSLTGTWTSTQIAGVGPSGTVTGTVDGSSVIMTFALGVVTPDCSFPIRMAATVNASLTQMTAHYSTINCSFVLSGDTTLSKQ